MKSTRTDYRMKRILLLKEIIGFCSLMLILYKRDLEQINLPLLKKTHKNFKNELIKVGKFPADSKKS